MAGLIVLAIFAGLFFAALWLAKILTSKLPPRVPRTPAMGLVVVLLLASLVADEIVGGFQFRALCAKNAVLKINVEKIKGKSVSVITDKCPRDVEGTAVRIHGCLSSYRDVATNEELGSDGWYVAKGGWFIRTIGFSDSTPPLTFPSACSSPDRRNPEEVYEFQFVKQSKGEVK